MRLIVAAAFAIVSIAVASGAEAQPSAFAAGLSDRGSFEAWLNSLTPASREGATYWSGQRSLAHPGDCAATGNLPEWVTACTQAKSLLDPSDFKRKTIPDYRAGWNSYGKGQPTVAPASASWAPDARLTDLASRDCRVALPTYQATDNYGRPVLRRAELSPEMRQRADECEREKQDAIRGLAADRQRHEEALRVAETQRRFDQEQAERARLAEEKAGQDRAQRALETSPTNVCATAAVARLVMAAFDDLSAFKARGIESVDIEHVVTRANNGGQQVSCHGIFITNRAGRMEGTITFRQNIAGDMITQWQPEP